jgi:glycosyltransferase involved in cell wall biosynthesis
MHLKGVRLGKCRAADKMAASGKHCLVYAPYSLNGRGPGESCASILSGFGREQMQTELFVPRTRKPLAGQVRVHQSLPPIARKAPWRLVSGVGLKALDRAFGKAIRSADAANTIAYFWPDPPIQLIELARQQGIVTVREMINTACATAGPILDAAYARLGLPMTHPVSPKKIRQENRELAQYDYFFASNSEVESSLARLGVRQDQILSTTFGWNPLRFAHSVPAKRIGRGVRVLYVGLVGVRKGVPELLEAWEGADVEGELILAGTVEADIAHIVAKHTAGGRVRLLGFVEDIGAVYLGSDIFVFPTLEEGGPQVTIEAASCGLPIITTPMGAARMVATGVTGVVVKPGAVSELADAIQLLARRPDLRHSYGTAAKASAANFDYQRVGARRCELLRRLISESSPET